MEVYELSVWHLTWDIIHPGLIEFEERIIKIGKNIVAAIIGKSYVGKSCAAILGEIVRQTQGQFNEGDINEWRSSYIKREY